MVDLSEHQEKSLFILVASDGLWDLRPRMEFFAKQFASSFVSDKSTSLLQKSVDIIDLVIPKNPNWYRDDISVIVAPT